MAKVEFADMFKTVSGAVTKINKKSPHAFLIMLRKTPRFLRIVKKWLEVFGPFGRGAAFLFGKGAGKSSR